MRFAQGAEAGADLAREEIVPGAAAGVRWSGCMVRKLSQRRWVIAVNSGDCSKPPTSEERGRGNPTGTISAIRPGRGLISTTRSPSSTASSVLWVKGAAR
ncbi:hypothetical protein [Streptomyces canus]|uniref:hypothetical protein n=1 Tax=Streptomyces canus TaxID=58343 RepID=UPI00381EE160